MGRILVEVAVETVADVETAVAAGADRLEVCGALDVGGVTPSAVVVQAAVRSGVPAVVMIRPRPGGFAYSAAEHRQMCAEATLALESGAAGIVFGTLDADDRINPTRTAEFVRLAAGRQAVFHRAFDLTPDLFGALETLIELGVTRILTSGGEPTLAPPSRGAETVKRLIDAARGRIEILPGAGIKPMNVAKIIAATGCAQVHASCRKMVPPAARNTPVKPSFGFGPAENDAAFCATNADVAQALRAAVDHEQ